MTTRSAEGDTPAVAEAAARPREAPPRGTVHVVDDDDALRAALIRLCRSANIHAIGHATADDLLVGSVLERPACILLDVRLGDQNGLTVQDAFRTMGSTVPVVFLTGYGTIPMTVRAMRSGATEFLTKPVNDDVLLSALRRALAQDLQSFVYESTQADIASRLAQLTQRERDVFGCAIGGLMNKQIAAELGVTEITAKVHKRRMMEKMGARSVADLVRVAERLKIVPTRLR